MLTPAETVREFMDAFKVAWPASDAPALARFFSVDASYHNGPLEPVRGRESIISSVAQMMSLGGRVDVRVVHLVAEGPTVMSERVDCWMSGDRTATLRVAGVFEVEGGLISAWRDYFCAGEFTAQSAESASSKE